jgi:hypothetical protein
MPKEYNLFREDAHLNEEALALYVDALKLNKVYLLPSAILGHVGDCEECKSEIVETLSLVEERAYHIIEPHPYLTKKVDLLAARFSIAYRIAAVVLVGLSIGILFYLFRSMKGERSVVDGSGQATQIVQPENRKGLTSEAGQVNQQHLLADNFSVSPNLENLVNSVLRSASPLVLSPKNGLVVSQPILFVWKTQESGPFTVKILSNTEKVSKSMRVEKSRLLFTGKLNPGLYYWKLECKDELLYVGKFMVK